MCVCTLREGGPAPNLAPPPPLTPEHEQRGHELQGGGGYWGPDVDKRVNNKDILAKQRQQEYNEYLARQHGAPMRAPPGGAVGGGGGGGGQQQNPPQYPQQQQQQQPGGGGGGGGGGPGVGLHFGEEVQPRAFGHGGMAGMFGNSEDQQRRNKAEERKREYAAELERQIAEKQRRKQMEREANRRQASNAVGMGNVIRDMRDGMRDGMTDGGIHMYGVPNAYAGAPGANYPGPGGGGGGGGGGGDVGYGGPGGGGGGGGGGFDPNARMERQPPQHHQHQHQQGGGGGGGGGGGYQGGQGPPAEHRGGAWNPQPPQPAANPYHWNHGLSNLQGREVNQEQYEAMAKKKQEYQRALEDQIREKAERKAREKREKEERELKEEREAANYNPWGKGGGGAPVKDDRGNVVTNLKDMRHDANERRDNPDAYQRSPHRGPSTPPRHRPNDDHDHGGGGGGGGGGGDFSQISPRFRFRSDYANMLPHEMEAKHRAQEDLQSALERQIAEKKRQKEEEKAREKAEQEAEERRLALEQQRLREAFEKEQAAERAKQAERLAAEEEAYNLAAEKRKEQQRRDRGEKTPEPPPLQERLDNSAQRGPDPPPPPPRQPTPPPRGPTPAGAKELQQLRDELQAEHAELMRAMSAQNEHMALLQRRAEMAERHSAEARVELAEMRENLSDQVFLSSLPSMGGPGGVPGAKIPLGRPRSGKSALHGPPYVSPNDDYGMFMRDGMDAFGGGRGGDENSGGGAADMGPALDGGVGRGFGGGGDGGGEVLGSIDLGASMTAESSFIFPGQTLQRAPFLGGGGGGGGKPPLGRPRSSGLDSLAEDGPGPASYQPPGTAATDASDSLNDIHKKSEARLKALQRMEGGGGGGGGGGGDVDQLDQLLKNFLNVTRGGTPQNDEGAPLLDDGDDGMGGGGGHNVGAAMGGYYVGGGPGGGGGGGHGGRPDTQMSVMSMDAESRFIRH